MVVFAGRRCAGARWPVARDDGAEGGGCPPQLVCQLLFAVDTRIWLATSGRGTAYGRLPPHKQADLVSDLFCGGRP